jgi:hypothetical protein
MEPFAGVSVSGEVASCEGNGLGADFREDAWIGLEVFGLALEQLLSAF